jgi:hypothetical protein
MFGFYNGSSIECSQKEIVNAKPLSGIAIKGKSLFKAN